MLRWWVSLLAWFVSGCDSAESPSGSARILVLGHDGQPRAGVPVQVSFTTCVVPLRPELVLWTGHTDSNGEVDAPLFFERNESDPELDRDRGVHASSFDASAGATLQYKHAESRPVVLRLGCPTASVALTVLSPSETPVTGAVVEVTKESLPTPGGSDEWHHVTDERGRVELHGFNLSRELFVHVWVEDARFAPLRVPLDPPAEDGRVERTVSMRRGTSFAGLGDVDHATVVSRGAWDESWWVTCLDHCDVESREGRFVIRPPGWFRSELDGRVVLVRGDPKEQRPEHDPLAIACVELPPSWPEGVVDLGRPRFEVAPLLASGRVVDAAGRPIRGALVEMKGRSQSFGARSDEQGRFTVRGTTGNEEWSIGASRGNHVRDRREVPVGSTDLVLTIES